MVWHTLGPLFSNLTAWELPPSQFRSFLHFFLPWFLFFTAIITLYLSLLVSLTLLRCLLHPTSHRHATPLSATSTTVESPPFMFSPSLCLSFMSVSLSLSVHSLTTTGAFLCRGLQSLFSKSTTTAVVSHSLSLYIPCFSSLRS